MHAQVPVDVATFLLNEKRADVMPIEARLKVNVLLIPNLHLETPNYTVERLRHDDLNNAEPLPLSFDLVRQPEQEDAGAGRRRKRRQRRRQEAVVKGITPAQPAPLPAEKPAPAAQPEETWFDKVIAWFKPKPAEVAVPQPKPLREERGAAVARRTARRQAWRGPRSPTRRLPPRRRSPRR